MINFLVIAERSEESEDQKLDDDSDLSIKLIDEIGEISINQF